MRSNPAIRLLVPLLFLLSVLAACAPQQQTVATNVLPTIFSVRTDDADILIQGRYFGTGEDGVSGGNYVEIGADLTGEGGTAYEADDWTDKRIRLALPDNVASGSVRVFVNGQPSNVLPLSRH
ncbi:MAG TPA: hypothetical protein VK092_05645 [Deinococcales bacterium]|nr:hypothetical protein [Deinococcales bacterium]